MNRDINTGRVILFTNENGAAVFKAIKSLGMNVLVVIPESKKDIYKWTAALPANDKLVFSASDRQHAINDMQVFSPDLFVSVAYPNILKADMLNVPRYGGVNLHGGRLPQYRGANVLNWAMINGEKSTAMTIHYMDAGIDTGPVIDAIEVPILFEDTALSLRDKMREATIKLIEKCVPDLVKEKISATAQDERQAKYWKKRQPEDGLFAWDESSINIYNKIRALVGAFGGAHYLQGSKKVLVNSFMTYEEVCAEKIKRGFFGK